MTLPVCATSLAAAPRAARRFGAACLLAPLLALSLATSACAGGGDDTASARTAAAVSSADFILGADVSMLESVERGGGRFTTADGRSGSALQILRASQVGWGRLRLWHTPVNARDVYEGDRLVSRKGQPVGGGNNDLALTVRLCQRLHAQGMKLLLDIHYSDFWVDPAHQGKPAAWESLQGEALATAVKDYTVDVLTQMHAAGCDPQMVQVGNEINGGFLWPDGKTWQERPGEVIGGTEGFHTLLKAGIAGVRDTDALRGGRTPIVLHLANSGDNALYRRVFDGFTAAGLDFDVIGLSWYPYFHGPLSALRANLQDLTARYRKPMLVVEAAYGWTDADADNSPNMLSAELIRKTGVPATPEGQAQLLKDLLDTVRAVPGGLGVMWWAPEWLPVPGAGWRTGDGNGWENQTLFDTQGRALPALQVLRDYVR